MRLSFPTTERPAIATIARGFFCLAPIFQQFTVLTIDSILAPQSQCR